MAFTKEQREKGIATRKAKAAARQESLSQIVSTKGVSEPHAALLARIADLEAQLKASDAARGEAEKIALAAAEAQGALMQRDIQEVPTGKTVKLSRCTGYKVVGHKDDGRDILKPIFERVAVPTYFYKIDIPPVGGTDCKLNGTPYYHGAVYEFDVDTLRSVKDIVYRLWKHDADIHGSDENVYRKKRSPVISARM
jgi:hypothetical protein